MATKKPKPAPALVDTAAPPAPMAKPIFDLVHANTIIEKWIVTDEARAAFVLPAPPVETSVEPPKLAELLPGWTFRRHSEGWVGCTRPDGVMMNVAPGDNVKGETLRLLLVDLHKAQEGN